MRSSTRDLVFGQLVGQLALLAAIPVLTRLLSPSEMGFYQIGLSAALILQPLGTLRRELVLPFGSSANVRRHRLVGLGASLGLSGLIGALALIAWLGGYAEVATAGASTALILLSLGLIYIENAYLIRIGAQRRLALRNLLGGILSATLQVAAAYSGWGAVGISLALLVGRAFATMLTMLGLRPGVDSSARGQVRRQRPVSAILSAMIAAASSQAIILGSAFSLGAAGSAQIAVAQRIASTPSSLIGQGLMQVILGSAAPLIRDGRSGLTKRLRSQTLRLGALAIVLALLLVFAGPSLAVPVLGPAWSQAGTLIAVFAVPVSMLVVALPATTLLIPLGHERMLLVLQLARLLAILAAIVVSSWLGNGVVAVSAYTSAAWSLAYIPLLGAGFWATAKHDRGCSEPMR